MMLMEGSLLLSPGYSAAYWQQEVNTVKNRQLPNLMKESTQLFFICFTSEMHSLPFHNSEVLECTVTSVVFNILVQCGLFTL